MGKRTFVPFDVFAMAVDVPVSTLVRDSGLGWTCGQCPLDREARIVAPDDLAAQSRFVCDMIETVAGRGGFAARDVAALHVYYAETAPGEGEAALEIFAGRFPHGPVVVPIPVPHFYYEGMLIEVDVFLAEGMDPPVSLAHGPIGLRIASAENCIHVGVEGPVSHLEGIPRALEANGLAAAALLADHWFLPQETAAGCVTGLRDSPYATSPDAAVVIGPGRPDRIAASLVFAAAGGASRLKSIATEEDLRVRLRRHGQACWISGVAPDPANDLVGQTRAIMDAIARALDGEGLSFGDVVKLTAHYVGGATPEELHGNMKVRHGYHASPGPASTGLPVTALACPDARIAIDVHARG